MHSYSASTSSSNLIDHLANKHQTVITTTTAAIKQKSLMESFFPPTKKSKSNAPKIDSKLIFNRQLLLSICRDLGTFHQVEKEGFREFWNIYNPNYKLPCRSTLEIGCLDDVFTCCMNKMIDFLKKTPDHATITFDCWSDNAKQRSFVGYTYHFLNKNWEIKTAVLKVAALQRPNTGRKLRDNFHETLNEFGIADKKISVVTDGGSNVKKCAELLGVRRSSCISHGIHQLITTDLLKHDSMEEIRNLIVKLKTIQRKMLYKFDELKTLDIQQKNKNLIEVMERFAQMGTFSLFV